MEKERKPNFIIIGAMKSATTSLYTYIKQHPNVFMTKIKEPMFFNNLNKKYDFIIKGKKSKKITTFDEYYALFKDVMHEKAIGEASPSYLYNEQCAQLIKKHLPKTKIIAIIRQPVERAYSNYLHAKRADREPINNFEDAFNSEESRIKKKWSPLYHYKSQGLYYKQLKKYYNLFDKKQIKIILFQDLINNPKKTTKEVFNFLEVDDTFTSDTSIKANVSGVPKGLTGWIIMKMRKYNLIPNIEFNRILPRVIIAIILKTIYSKPDKIDKRLIDKLTNKYYKKDIKKLELLIEKNLSHWL
tara:strand:+ start:1855 stop:2754 length:900 start_codon:yes stop_codon:yes gene_type:complete